MWKEPSLLWKDSACVQARIPIEIGAAKDSQDETRERNNFRREFVFTCVLCRLSLSLYFFFLSLSLSLSRSSSSSSSEVPSFLPYNKTGILTLKRQAGAISLYFILDTHSSFLSYFPSLFLSSILSLPLSV
jgi:hypothetical protein